MQTGARPAHLHLTLPGWDLLIRPHITQPRCMATEELLCTATYILTLISVFSSFVSFILIFVEGKKSRGCKKLRSGPEHSGARLLMLPHPRSTWRSMWRHRCGHRALHQLQLGPVSLGSSCSWCMCHEDPAAAGDCVTRIQLATGCCSAGRSIGHAATPPGVAIHRDLHLVIVSPGPASTHSPSRHQLTDISQISSV